MPRILLTLLTALIAAAERFPPPSGPHHVGIVQHVFSHTTPNDPIAPPNTSSVLLATIYYPTLSNPNPNTTASYLDATTAEVWSTPWRLPSGALASLSTWNQPNAPFLSKHEHAKLHRPTVILSPGGASNAIVYNFLSSELASQGYTVVALDHPGEAGYVHLPDGSGIFGLGATTPWNRTLLEAIYAVRVSDALALIRALYPPYVASIDAPFNTTHFFVVGHSLGGAAAAQIAALEPAVLGGVNLDGLFVDVPDVKKPFLMMAGNEHTPEIDPTWAPFSRVQSGWWEWVNVTGTDHLDFGDFGDWVDLLGLRNRTAVPMLGRIWAPRMNRIVNAFVVGLFEAVLAGRGLEWRAEEFPEVVRVNGSERAV